MNNFKIEIDQDGIALITFDAPGKTMNTLTAEAYREVEEIGERVKADAAIKGAVFCSGKDSGFCAGADLNDMLSGALLSKNANLKDKFDQVYSINRSNRTIETCGKPVAIALEGLALGGGLELALACHYRVAADNPRIKLGLVETKIGLIPGGGGTQRLPRLIGAQPALLMMSMGENKSPQEAKALGFVDEVVPAGKTVEVAKAWVKSKGGKYVARWDEKGFRIPGGGPQTPGGYMTFVGANALIAKQTYGNYPSQTNLLKAVYEGLIVPMDAGLRIESRYFLKTLMTPSAQGMIRTFFMSMQEITKGGNRPASYPKYEVKKASVLGAGMMGAGIAYVQALAGVETVLIDVSQEGADKGKAHCKDLLDKQIARGRMDKAKAEGVLARITATSDYSQIKGSDIVIEAVFENEELKEKVTKQAEAHLADVAVFGSNTSTLPITGLAKASVRPKNFIGVHFFSPVERMGLVEIILGKETSEETLAKAIDYVLAIKKTPIVVNDARGFYTSRVFSTYLAEGVEMLAEGIKPAIIENVGKMTGMPRAPLEMADDVALDLMYKIRGEAKAALGDKFEAGAIDGVIETIVKKEGRLGRKNNKGFYDYPTDGSKKKLWPGLADLVKVKIDECPPALRDEYKKRLLYIQAIETAKCFEEGVITDPRDADVGSILAWGFAPYTGGVVSMMDLNGIKEFVAECDALAAKYGPRFKPNALLRDLAAKGDTFYGRFSAAKKKAA
jgi:3-hydroxyacyl-CoA dehydrogenase/enoyl-CoA hydratase/3-hydroxybutyryl-CoA epimerase